MYRAIAVVLPVLAASACQGGEDTAPASEAQTTVDEVVVVSERWVSEADTLWDVDTPDVWTDGTSGMVLVTGKATHDLRVFDAATGATMKPVGREGSGADTTSGTAEKVTPCFNQFGFAKRIHDDFSFGLQFR